MRMDITLLDGSIGQQLVKLSGDKPTNLWSTKVMIDHPALLDQVHEEYFRVGATIATTNTYPVLQDRLDANGINADIRQLWDIAVSSARAAVKKNGKGRIDFKSVRSLAHLDHLLFSALLKNEIYFLPVAFIHLFYYKFRG